MRMWWKQSWTRSAHKTLADVELLFMNDRKRLLEAESIPGEDDRQQGT